MEKAQSWLDRSHNSGFLGQRYGLRHWLGILGCDLHVAERLMTAEDPRVYAFTHCVYPQGSHLCGCDLLIAHTWSHLHPFGGGGDITQASISGRF